MLLIRPNQNRRHFMYPRSKPHKRSLLRFYLAFETMRNFSVLQGSEVLPEVLEKICEAKEFAEVVLRMGEKKMLNALNHPKNGAVRFKLVGKVKTPAMKVNLLIQVKGQEGL